MGVYTGNATSCQYTEPHDGRVSEDGVCSYVEPIEKRVAGNFRLLLEALEVLPHLVVHLHSVLVTDRIFAQKIKIDPVPLFQGCRRAE
jgi:hypothetical protein